jgi:2-oxoacid:acceptor oxidoreductase delta subunit (pyruvate/2-ketoisovalerate family)
MTMSKEKTEKRGKGDWKNYADLPPGPISMRSTLGVSLTGSWRTVKPVIHLDECIKCMTCWKFCPDVSIEVRKDGYPKINYIYCKGCGICSNECPKECIEMVLEDVVVVEEPEGEPVNASKEG